MKLCFPALSNTGADALMCAHFGSAPHFILFDLPTKEYETISNPKASHEHGSCRPIDLLVAQRGIEAVVCKGMGKGALTAMEREQIKAFTTQSKTVGGAVAEFMAGTLVKLDPATACSGHGAHD